MSTACSKRSPGLLCPQWQPGPVLQARNTGTPLSSLVGALPVFLGNQGPLRPLWAAGYLLPEVSGKVPGDTQVRAEPASAWREHGGCGCSLHTRSPEAPPALLTAVFPSQMLPETRVWGTPIAG